MTTGNTDLTIRITGRLDGAIRDLDRLQSKLQGATRGFDKLRSSAVAAGRRIRSALGGLGAAIGAGGAVAALGDFEETLARIVGLVGIAKGEVDAMGQALLRMGPEVGRGPNELARALYAVTRAGARGELALDIVRQAARAAAAGLGETAVIAGTVESAIDAYGAANLDAGTTAGILVAAARESGSAAEELAPALGRMLPIAAQLGVEFHQAAGAAAFLAESGLGADRAVTAMHSALEQVLEPTDAARQAATEIGLSFEEVQRVLREEGLPAALRLIRDAAKEDSEALERLFPDVESLVDVLALVGPEAGEANRVLQTLARAGVGDLDRAFGAVADTAKHRLNAALAEFDVGKIAEGGDILAAFAAAARWAADNVKLLVAAGAGYAAIVGLGLAAPGIMAAVKSARFLGSAVASATKKLPLLTAAWRATPLGRALSIVAGVGAALWAWSSGADSAAAKTGEAADATDRLTEAERRRAELASARRKLASLERQRAVPPIFAAPGDELSDYGMIGESAPGEEEARKRRDENLDGLIASLKAEIARLERRNAALDALERGATMLPTDFPRLRPDAPDAPSAADLRDPLAERKALRAWHEDELLALQGKRIEQELRNEERARAAIAARYAEAFRAVRRAESDPGAAPPGKAPALPGAPEPEGPDPAADSIAATRRDIAAVRAEIDAGAEAMARARNPWLAAARERLAEYAADAADATDEIAAAGARMAKGLEDAFVQLASTGKLSFRDLTQSILADLTRISVRQSIVGPLASGLFGALGLGGPAAAPAAPAGPFAPPAGGFRFHRGGIAGGLRPNEVPAILTRGEGVFTHEQMRALAPAGAGAPRMDIRFENRGTPQREVARRTEFDGRDWVIAVVVEDVEEGGPFSRALSRNLGGATG